MGELLQRAWRAIALTVAVAWLMVLAPIELATALARLLAGPLPALGPLGVALTVMRVVTTAGGMMLGRRFLQRQAVPRGLATTWAAADLCTLGLVLATAQLPSSRAPGDAWLIWLGYACAAAVVVAAARVTRPRGCSSGCDSRG